MKLTNTKNILYGANIGEHGFEPAQIIEEIDRCLERGMNFVCLRPPKNTLIPHDYFRTWAKYLSERHVYFIFLYTIQFAPEGHDSILTPELVSEMREIAGEYYLGDMLGELGSVFCCKMPGYFIKGHAPMPPQDLDDMQTAKDNYIKAVSAYMDIERRLGLDKIGVSALEASTLSSYNLEAGTNLPFIEIMGTDPELSVAAVRGAAEAYGINFWGTYVAHEWYAGHYHADALKRKRLEIEYKFAYMNGTHVLLHESGDDVLSAHGREYPADSIPSTECREFIDSFCKFVRADDRPAGNPVVKVAFMQGNLDSWVGTGRQSLCTGSFAWSQFNGREWGYDEPEWAWNLLDEIGKKRKWWEFDSYACDGRDLSSLPPYGIYDIIPASSSTEVMAKYDTIIYCGWNTMTEDQLTRLEAYVEQGGTLLMTAAHLNTSSKRKAEFSPVRSGDLSRLFGVKLSGKTFASGVGMKFRTDSMVDGVLYPRSLNSYNDPLFSLGYVDYAETELCGAVPVATLEDSFHFVDQPGQPTILENKLGKGVAILMTTVNYPGKNSVYPLYRFLVKELMRAGNESASVKLAAPDAVRYTVYPDGSVYLLNLDYDSTLPAEIITKYGSQKFELAPLELKHIKLKK